MVPIEPWRNSTPFFGAVAFCTTKIDYIRASLTLTSLNTLATGDLFNEEEVIEVDQLEEKNGVKNNMPMPESHTVPALSHLCGIFYTRAVPPPFWTPSTF